MILFPSSESRNVLSLYSSTGEHTLPVIDRECIARCLTCVSASLFQRITATVGDHFIFNLFPVILTVT